MPSAEPVKDRIASAAVTALEGVLTGAGYYTDLGLNVSRRMYAEQDLQSLRMPAATVVTVDGGPAPDSCTGSYRERFTLAVEAWFRSETAEGLDREGIRVEADVKRAILSTAQLGMSGTVVAVQPGNNSVALKQFGDDRLGLKVVEFTVDYNWTATTP